MILGQSYNPNEFRGNLPDSIRTVSADLYAFLRETLQGLRQFNTDALYGALRVPEAELITRYIDETYPINSKAAIRLSTGQTAFAEFLRLPDDPILGNEGRLIFRRVGREQAISGVETEFVGVDFTRQGAGRYGWVVYGGYVPIPVSLYSGPQPALFGVLDGRLSEVPSLKFGTIKDGMAFLSPAFGVPGSLDETSLADFIARLAETESLVAGLRADIDQVSGLFGQFETRNLIALSRLENRQDDERLTSVFAEFLQQRADLAAYGRQIGVEREFIDQVTGNVIAYANAAQRETVVAQSFSRDSEFWASVSQTNTLDAQAFSQTSQSSAQISETASVAAGESAAQALAAVSAMASIGSAALTENGGFDNWDDPLTPPDNWALMDGGVATARVAGFNSAFAVKFTKEATDATFHHLTQNTTTQLADQLGAVQPGWYVLEVDVRLDAGTFSDDAIWVRSRLGGTLLEDRIFAVVDMEAGGVVVGAGVVGRVYRVRMLFQLTQPTLDNIELLVMSATTANTVANEVSWDRVDLRVASQAEIATQTVLTSVVTQVASLNTQVALNVTALTAQATQISALQASTTLLNTTTATHTSQISALTSENVAQATSITGLSASLSGLSSTSATHTTEISALATVNSAQAISITSLTSSVGGLTSSVTTLTSAIDGVEARYGVTVSAGGAITGFELLGGGGTSEFNVQADRFRVRTSSGDQTPFEVSGSEVRLGTDLYVQSHRIIFDNGVTMRVQGTGFGSADQFLDWAGPSGDPNTVTELAAIQYLKTDGSAYFGGALTTGTITNQGRTTLGSATEFLLGPFISNGGLVLMTLGVSSGGVLATDSATWTVTSPDPDPYTGVRETFRGVYVLERSLNNGVSYTNIGTYIIDSTSASRAIDAGSTGGTEPQPLRRWQHGWGNDLSQTTTQVLGASSEVILRLRRTSLTNLTTGLAVTIDVTTNISIRTVEE